MVWPWEVPWGEILTRRFWLGEGEHAGVLRDPLAAPLRDPGAALSGGAMGAGAALAAAGIVAGTTAVLSAMAAKAAAAAAAAKAAAFGTALKGVLLWEAWQMVDVAQEFARAGIRRWEKAPYAPPPVSCVRTTSGPDFSAAVPATRPPAPVATPVVPVFRPPGPAVGPRDKWSRVFASRQVFPALDWRRVR